MSARAWARRGTSLLAFTLVFLMGSVYVQNAVFDASVSAPPADPAVRSVAFDAPVPIPAPVGLAPVPVAPAAPVPVPVPRPAPVEALPKAPAEKPADKPTRQGLGVGGVASANCGAANVVCASGDSSAELRITASNVIYDGRGHSRPRIVIAGSNVTVQNFYLRNGAGEGIYSQGRNNVIQNNDIAQVAFDTDDINAITFFGDGTKILYNKAHDVIKGDPGNAHTDCIQTWSTPSKSSSSNVEIRGNDCRSPLPTTGKHLRQCVMAEGSRSSDGGGGGSGVSRNWTITGNFFQCYANQTVKLDDIHNVDINGNKFAGAGQKAISTGSLSSAVEAGGNALGGGYRALLGD